VERCHRRWEIASAAVRHYDARHRLDAIRQRLDAQTVTLASAAHARLLAGRSVLDRRTAALEALSPVAILNRGYALVFDANGQLVKDATRVKPGDDISARLARGSVQARVTAVESDTPKSGGPALE
jgi:exodeoxyribonuclease VII large subunit